MAVISVDGPLPVVTGSAWPGLRYFCTTRAGGKSTGHYASLNLGLHTGDDPDIVHANRQRLLQMVPAEPLWLNQVHGATVVDADSLSSAASLPEADAAITMQPNRVLAVLTADCLPVVIVDDEGQALGVAHAGWRGLSQGVLETTMQRLQQRCPQASGWRAWVGPAIGPGAFEVGEDVRQAFVAGSAQAAQCFVRSSHPGKWMADLPALAAQRLRVLGVSEIVLSGLCTYSQPEWFYSYRRQAKTGRMATCAWLTFGKLCCDLP